MTLEQEISHKNLLEILRILSMNPIDQCEYYGFYNVGWEIRDDSMSAIVIFIGAWQNHIEKSKIELLIKLENLLKYLPIEYYNVENIRENHIYSMSSVPWGQIRSLSKEIIVIID